MNILPFQHAEKDERRNAQHAGHRIMNAVKPLGQPKDKGQADDNQGLFFHGSPGADILVEFREFVFRIRAKHQIHDCNRCGYGYNCGGHGILDPIHEGDFNPGKLFKKGRGDHAASSADQSAHPAAGACEGQGKHHEFGRIGMRVDPHSLHERKHGDDADSAGGRVVHKRGRDSEAHGKDKGKTGDAASRPFDDIIAKPLGKTSLIEGYGKNQTAHNKHNHGVHIGGPGVLYIGNSHNNKKNTDADCRNFQGNRFDNEEENQDRQNGQKSLSLGREAVNVLNLDAFYTQLFHFRPEERSGSPDGGSPFCLYRISSTLGTSIRKNDERLIDLFQELSAIVSGDPKFGPVRSGQ